MTEDELAAFTVEVGDALQRAGVQVAHRPMPVICASRPSTGDPRGREYPWGIALSEGGRGPAASHTRIHL